MAGQASGGQKLTPNRNVNAPAGIGGDKWGANGGGIAPIQGTPLIKQTLSNGQTSADYLISAPSTRSVLSGMANASVSGQSVDTTADNFTQQGMTADAQSPGAADSQV